MFMDPLYCMSCEWLTNKVREFVTVGLMF